MRWGARLLGAGLTAALAVGFTASPASADAGAPSTNNVQPEEVSNEAVCPDDTDIEFSLSGGVPTGHNTYDVFDVGHITLDVTDPPNQTFAFSIDGSIAARQVIVHSAPSANRYRYDSTTGFPNGITQDGLLHAPSGVSVPGYYDLTGIDFCLINSPYNGTGT
ncbi:hypothetical protein [Streptomyces sp. V3I7]|uniref:hypothetical protein n=1 Tax=Streptomyces sp. V3I7 TaxID=3042278 RepID=UPI0027D8839D|nr:hypothetical protein [Streptomyces sp. V3I7]